MNIYLFEGLSMAAQAGDNPNNVNKEVVLKSSIY